MDTSQPLQDLRLRRVARRYHLDLIILFGSHAKGRARPDSDLDIAVRAYKPGWIGTRRVPRWRWQLDVIGAVGNAFDYKYEVDVSFLNRATPLFLDQVARHGKLLYERKPGDFLTFKVYAARRYEDNEKFFGMTRRYLEKVYGERARSSAHRSKAGVPQAVAR